MYKSTQYASRMQLDFAATPISMATSYSLEQTWLTVVVAKHYAYLLSKTCARNAHYHHYRRRFMMADEHFSRADITITGADG